MAALSSRCDISNLMIRDCDQWTCIHTWKLILLTHRGKIITSVYTGGGGRYILSTSSSNSLVSSCDIVHYHCSVRALFVLKPMYPMWTHGQIKLSESALLLLSLTNDGNRVWANRSQAALHARKKVKKGSPDKGCNLFSRLISQRNLRLCGSVGAAFPNETETPAWPTPSFVFVKSVVL